MFVHFYVSFTVHLDVGLAPNIVFFSFFNKLIRVHVFVICVLAVISSTISMFQINKWKHKVWLNNSNVQKQKLFFPSMFMYLRWFKLMLNNYRCLLFNLVKQDFPGPRLWNINLHRTPGTSVTRTQFICSPTSGPRHLLGFEPSLINFKRPHFCPQLFIGLYYKNLNLLFDYWELPPEACGFWCIIEQSQSHRLLIQ